MKRVLLFLAVLFCSALIQPAFAQPGNLEGDFISGSWNDTQTLTDLGTFRQFRGQRTGANGNGNFLFNPAPANYTAQWTGSNAPNFVRSLNTYHNGGAFYYTSGGWNTNLQIAMTNNSYYTFNLLENGAANSSIQILETTFNPVTVSSTTSAWGANGTRIVTVNMSAAPAGGENVFVRYTVNGFTNSTLVQCSFTGAVGTATIPIQAQGSTVQFYAYSSNKSLASIVADVTGNGQSAHDLATLNLGSGLSYTMNPVHVLSSAGTSAGVYLDYATLKAAFDAINPGVIHLGSVAITLVGNTTETLSAVLNQVAGVTSIGIQPAGGATRTITGAITGHLIDLNGADNVTIDGLNTGSNTLTISNTATGASSAIRFIADASTNTIQNCTVQGSASTAANGVIFFSTGTTTGNDGNNINTCTITAAGANLPINAIFSLGTSAAIDNSGNTLNANNISDYFSAASVSIGINLAATGNSTWTITSNRLFQSATRIFTTGNTHNGIFIGVGSGYTITGNVIGFANVGGTLTTNLVGNSVALTGTFPTLFTTTGTATTTRYIGLNCAFTAGGAVSSIQNNTIAGIALYTGSGATTSNGILCGINITSGNANVGTVTGNTIGATTGNGSLYACSGSGGGAVVGIYATSTNTVSIQNNKIGAIDAVCTTAALSGAFTGIDVAGVAGIFTIGTNDIGNTTADNIRCGYTLTAGSLSNSGTLTSTTGASSPMVGIRNTSTGATSSITTNTLQGWVNSTTAGGVVTGITNTGAITTSVNVSNNFLGSATMGWMRYAFFNTNATGLVGINVTLSTGAASITISTNDFRGIVYSASSTGPNTYITWAHPSSTTDNINSNTFTNLNVNTGGSITFLTRVTSSMTATGVENINSNNIVTGFNKGGSAGTVALLIANQASVSGSVMNNTGNNFSNITLSGTATMVGWSNTEGGAPTKNITGNTFSNWTCGSGAAVVISSNFGGNNTTVSSNTITNITGTGQITAIVTGANNSGAAQTIAGNTITTLTSSGPGDNVRGISGGSSSVTTMNINGQNVIGGLSSTTTTGSITGINILASAVTNIARNKIYDLSGNQAGTIVTGVNVASGTTLNINNNLIGDLRATAATGLNAILGLNLSATSTYNVHFNTIYLNATSSSVTTFGNSCVLFSSTATSLNMQDNVLTNLSVPAQNGTNVATNGIAACLRRSSGTAAVVPTNYNVASNNNAYWCNPTAGTNNHMTYVEGTATITNPQNTVANMKTFMVNRDQVSVQINPTYLSTVGSNANFLHIDTTVATPIESGGATVAGITVDYDNVVRNVTTPDIGADEFAGIAADLTPPTITYTALGLTCSTGNRTLSGVTVSDATKVDTTATFRPRVYYRKNAGSYFSQPGTLTAGNPSSGTWSFTIVAANMGGLAVADVVSYYVIAQDSLVVPNVTSNPAGGLVATDVNTVSTHPTTPNSYTIASTLTGTYTVGAAGTYLTLDAAFAAYNSSCLGGAVVFSLIDNTYAVPTVALNANADASATNTLTIKPTLANTTINGSIATAVIKLNGADYVIIDGSIAAGTNSACSPVVSLSRDLTITNTAITAGTAAVWLSSAGVGAGATNNVVKNCNLAAGVDQSTSSTNATFGIVVSGATLGIVEGADNNNNTFENNSITRARYGIYARSTGTTGAASDALFNTGNIVRQNIVGPSAFGTNQIGIAGIVMQGQNNATVSYNEVRFVGTLVAQASPGADRAGISFLDAKNSVMSHNNVHDIIEEETFSSFGLSMGASNIYTTANTVSNNMVYNVRANGTFPDQALGMAVGPGVNDKVVYNTIVMSGDIDPAGTTTADQSACGVRIDPLALAATNLDFRDNIITMDVTSNTGTLIHHALVRPTVGFVWGTGGTNYNDLYRNASNAQTAVGGTGTTVPYTAHTTLSNWQTATSQDANSVAIQPFFVSATNLHIDVTNVANAALDNLGTPITGVTTDFDCAIRSLTVPDMGADEFAIPACSGTPNAGTAVSSSPGPFCVSASTTLSLTGATAATGLTYQWQSSVTGVPGSFSPISGATANTFAVVGLGTTNYYQCEVTCTNSSLADTSSVVGLIINLAPTVAVTPTSYLICGTGSTPLTASGADTYVWSPAAGLSVTTGASVTANPTVTTTFTVTGTITATGCQGSTTVTIIVSPLVPTVTATASPLTVCEGGTVNLGTTVAGSTYTALSQNFNAGTNNWTTINNSTLGTPAAAAWTLRPNSYNYAAIPVTFNSNDASQFYLSNSDAQGSGGITATLLQSPAFSLAGLTAASLSYFHYYRDIGDSGDSAKVEVSTNGTNWTLVQSYQSTQGTPTGFVNATVNLNAYAGQATVYVRFNYKATWDYYWAIDNVSVTGPASYTYSWVSDVGGLTSTLQNPIHNPISVTNYTVTVTNQFGCQNSDGQSVGYVLSPLVDAGVNQTSCSTNPYLFSGASESFTTGLLWTTAGTGTFTGTGTLTPTYTPVPLEVGTSIKFYLSGSGLSPCVAALDSVQLVVSPLNTYYQDSDSDGFGNVFAPLQACTQPGGYVVDNTDCNDTNPALNPFTNWYADMDGDGFGSFIFLTSCTNPGLPGVVINGNDCNDSNPLIFPGSPEICQNFLDDDCDGIVDDGCSGVINDNWSDAIAVVGSLNAYPSCSVISGTCLNATISPEGTAAFVAVGGGRDVWYQFTAPSTGVQIKVQPTGFNALIELQTAAGVYIDHENVNPASGGLEILNRAGLTEGAVYRVGVRNFANSAGGAFTVCIAPLMDSRCASGSGTYAMCTNFKPKYTGANTYTFNFDPTGITPGANTSGSSASQISLTSAAPLSLQYNGTYDVLIDANYSGLVNGLGAADPITIVGTDLCSITIPAHPDVQVRLEQRCGFPTTLLKGSVLQGKPFVCGAVNFTVEFQQMTACSGGSTIGSTFFGTTTGASSTIQLSTVPGLLGGGKWYEVRWRPNFAYGSGSYGTVRTIFVGGAVMEEGNVANYGNMQEKDMEMIEAALYPNPNNGQALNLNLTNVDNGDVHVRITDAMGRLVYTNRFIVEGSLNTTVHFAQPLGSGLYLVELIADGKVTTLRMIVEQ